MTKIKHEISFRELDTLSRDENLVPVLVAKGMPLVYADNRDGEREILGLRGTAGIKTRYGKFWWDDTHSSRIFIWEGDFDPPPPERKSKPKVIVEEGLIRDITVE